MEHNHLTMLVFFSTLLDLLGVGEGNDDFEVVELMSSGGASGKSVATFVVSS